MARILNRIRGNQETHGALLEAHARGRLAATLLFAGPSGVGKKLFALALAQTLVCERGDLRGDEPGACGLCGACLRIESAQSESLMIVEPDGAQIKIEQARDILQFLSLQKLGRARVIIIDQAHLMNIQAANALLKSLEEPPEGTYFILITALAAAVLPTIRSRAQLVRFRPLNDLELKDVLGADVDPWVIDSAQGSVESAMRVSENREEFRELDEAALNFVAAAFERFPVDEAGRLKELLKEKSAQAFVANVLLGGFRNAFRIQGGLEPRPTSSDWLEFARASAHLQPRDLAAMADKALALPHEMARNIDRGLLLENFAIELGQAARRSGGA